MLSLIALLVVVFLIGLVVGAYSHKWLKSITGAPSNLSTANAGAAVSALVSHGEDAAVKAIGDVHDAAVAAVKG